MALDPIYDMLFQDGTGNPVFITDLSNLPRQINYLKAAINLFGQNIAILHGFDKNEDGSYTPGIILYKGVMYSYPGESIPAGSYLHSREILYGERVAENGVIYNAFKRYEFVANNVDTGDDLITSEPLTDDYVMKLKSAPIGPQMIATDMLKDKSVTSAKLADGAVTAAKLAEQPIVNRGAASDLNNATTYGFYTYDATTQNTPTSYGSIIVVEGTGRAGNWIQLALGYSAGNVNPSVFVRFRQNLESWSSWVKIWKSNDFNPDNYLPLSGGTMAGDIILPQSYRIQESNRNIVGRIVFGDSESPRTVLGANLYDALIISVNDIMRHDGTNEYKVWDAKNFNPDSKFDFNAAQLSDLNNAPNNAFFVGAHNAANAPVANSWCNGFTIAYGNNPDFRKQFCYAGDKWWTRGRNGTTWSSWSQIWDSGNLTPSSFAQTKRETFPSGGIDNITDSGFTGNIQAHFPGEEYSSIWQGKDFMGTILQLKLRDYANVQSLMYRGSKTKTWLRVWDSGNFNPSDYLSKENTTVYVPTGEYNPATKGYVDSAVENGSTKKVTATNLNTLISEGTCFFQFAASTTNAPMPRAGGGLQIVLTDKIIQFVTIFYSTSYAGPSFYRTSSTASASTFSPWSCFAENSDFGQNVYFEQQLDATHFNDAPVVKKLVKGSYTNKFGPATVALDNYASTQFPGTSSQYAPIAFRGYAKFTNYSTKATLAIVPVNSQSNNNYTFFTYVNPSSIYQVMANFTGGSASVREQVDYLVEITYGKVV